MAGGIMTLEPYWPISQVLLLSPHQTDCHYTHTRQMRCIFNQLALDCRTTIVIVTSDACMSSLAKEGNQLLRFDSIHI